MYCKNCGGAIGENQLICMNCGERVGNGNAYCANCGGAVSADAAACPNCGAPTTAGGRHASQPVQQPVQPVQPVQQPVQPVQQPVYRDPNAYLGGRNKKVVALLCMLFGGFGVHNFMLGDTKKGILKLVGTFCCCGLSSILVMMDLIEILAETYKVEPDKYF